MRIFFTPYQPYHLLARPAVRALLSAHSARLQTLSITSLAVPATNAHCICPCYASTNSFELVTEFSASTSWHRLRMTANLLAQ